MEQFVYNRGSIAKVPLRLIGAIMLGVSLYFCPNLIDVYDKDYPFLFRTEENKPFAIDRQKPEGAGFYSEGLSYKEFKVCVEEAKTMLKM